MDLELRGEGDVLGQMQSGGRSSLKMLRVVGDKDLIHQTKEIAQELYLGAMPPGLVKLIEKQDASALKQS